MSEGATPAQDVESASQVPDEFEATRFENKTAEGTIEQPRTARPQRKTGILWAIAVTAILSSTFLFALDNTVVADIQPKLIETFKEVDKLPWVSVSYGVGAVGLNLVW